MTCSGAGLDISLFEACAIAVEKNGEFERERGAVKSSDGETR